jgi:hypothetical protein
MAAFSNTPVGSIKVPAVGRQALALLISIEAAKTGQADMAMLSPFP